MSKCGICADKRRPEIDVALNGGWTLRMIAEHFPGISKDVAGRHKKHMGSKARMGSKTQSVPDDENIMRLPAHAALEAEVVPELPPLSPLPTKRPEHEGITEGTDALLTEVERIRRTAWALLEKADSISEGRTAVAALREIRGVTETRAKLECRPGFAVRDTTGDVHIQIAIASAPSAPDQPQPPIDITATR
jgi:hypothetical protein